MNVRKLHLESRPSSSFFDPRRRPGVQSVRVRASKCTIRRRGSPPCAPIYANLETAAFPWIGHAEIMKKLRKSMAMTDGACAKCSYVEGYVFANLSEDRTLRLI